MAAHVLIVDDDPEECRHVEAIVRKLGHIAETAGGGEAALARLARADAPAVAAVILDMVMPDLDGMAVLERMSRRSLGVPVIVQAAPASIDAGAAAMRAGAFDFLAKPAAPERVHASLSNALRIGALESEILRMRRSRSGLPGLEDIAMRSPFMERVRRLAERAARSRTPVLIEGERGVGKELLARAIHGSSARRSKPIVMVDGSDVREEELEPLLLGATASSALPQRLLQASGGTLLIDEIGALPAGAQETLGRALAGQEAGQPFVGRRQGADIRLIATTSRRLVDHVAEDSFDEQLFHVLNVFPIWLPPLRERRGDVPDLATRFLARLASEAGRSFITGISSPAMELLVDDPWPGNVRELEQAVFRAVMLCDGPEITPHEFPSIVARAGGGAGEGQVESDTARFPEPTLRVAVQEQVGVERAAKAAPIADSGPQPRYGTTRLLDERGELRPFEVVEEEVIRFAIGHYRGRMSEVARRLRIGRSTLYRKMKEYGIASGAPAAS